MAAFIHSAILKMLPLFFIYLLVNWLGLFFNTQPLNSTSIELTDETTAKLPTIPIQQFANNTFTSQSDFRLKDSKLYAVIKGSPQEDTTTSVSDIEDCDSSDSDDCPRPLGIGPRLSETLLKVLTF